MSVNVFVCMFLCPAEFVVSKCKGKENRDLIVKAQQGALN